MPICYQKSKNRTKSDYIGWKLKVDFDIFSCKYFSFITSVHKTCISPGLQAKTAKYQRFEKMLAEWFTKCKPHPVWVRMNVKPRSVILGLRNLLSNFIELLTQLIY